MALRPRRRRRRPPGWLLVGVVLSLVTVFVSVVSSAQTDGPGRRISELAYFDQMRPFVERSSAQGAGLTHVRVQGARLGRDGIRREVGRVNREARAVLAAAQEVEPPRSVTVPHGMLLTTLAVRSRAASVVDQAMNRAFGAEALNPIVEALAGAGEDMVASDRTYQVFLESLPSIVGSGPLMPASRWVLDPHPWNRTELGAFLAALRAGVATVPVHDLTVLVVTTRPPAVGNEGGALVLPLVRALQLEVVVANVGNSAEHDVKVAATLDGPGTNSETVRDSVSLEPGQRRALVLGGLTPRGVGPASLVVIVGPAPGESNSADNQRSIPIVVRG